MEEKFSSNLLKQVVNVEATSGLSAVSPQTPRAPQDTGQSAVAHCNQGLNGDGGGGCACDDDYSDEDSEHGNKIVVIMDGCPLMVLKGDGGIRNKLG